MVTSKDVVILKDSSIIITAKEFEIIKLVAWGLSNKEIGEKLGMSPRTVQQHLLTIFEKLEVHNRTEMVTMLILSGKISVEDLKK